MKLTIILLFTILFLSACDESKNVDKQEVTAIVNKLPYSREEIIIDNMKYVYLHDSYQGEYFAVINYTNDSLEREFYIKSINQLDQK